MERGYRDGLRSDLKGVAECSALFYCIFFERDIEYRKIFVLLRAYVHRQN